MVCPEIEKEKRKLYETWCYKNRDNINCVTCSRWGVMLLKVILTRDYLHGINP
jgi:hypothetical protein